MGRSVSSVYASYGMAETFWDIGFTDPQLDHADARDEFQRTISVDVDVVTGKVTLNEGYEKGSEPYEQEHRLFSTYRHAIIEALVGEVSDGDADYKAFMARANEDREYRLRSIAHLEDEMAASDHDDEDVAA